MTPSEFSILNLEGKEVYILRAQYFIVSSNGDLIFFYDELNNIKHVVVVKNVSAVLKKD